jgi:hypothetical protein
LGSVVKWRGGCILRRAILFAQQLGVVVFPFSRGFGDGSPHRSEETLGLLGQMMH